MKVTLTNGKVTQDIEIADGSEPTVIFRISPPGFFVFLNRDPQPVYVRVPGYVLAAPVRHDTPDTPDT